MSQPPRPARFPLDLERVRPVPAAGAVGGRATAAAAQRLGPSSPTPLPNDLPAGLGMDSAAVRKRMVERLRAQGLQHEAVAQALLQVERHRFVDTALAGQAYEDTSLPIGLSQTISKPSVVGHMLAFLCDGAAAKEAGHLGRVLEIGTGCGYQAALLVLLGRSVVSIERLLPLFEKARANLEPYRRAGDLRLMHGDGQWGHAPRAPYTSIISAAGGHALPSAWVDQLAVGGRLVAPLHDTQQGRQVLWVVDRTAQGLVSQRHDVVQFVPLESGTA
jgi:protein-L-isoaspartate(D-aspartate) O-methyltransferase